MHTSLSTNGLTFDWHVQKVKNILKGIHLNIINKCALEHKKDHHRHHLLPPLITFIPFPCYFPWNVWEHPFWWMCTSNLPPKLHNGHINIIKKYVWVHKKKSPHPSVALSIFFVHFFFIFIVLCNWIPLDDMHFQFAS